MYRRKIVIKEFVHKNRLIYNFIVGIKKYVKRKFVFSLAKKYLDFDDFIRFL